VIPIKAHWVTKLSILQMLKIIKARKKTKLRAIKIIKIQTEIKLIAIPKIKFNKNKMNSKLWKIWGKMKAKIQLLKVKVDSRKKKKA
jgi:hypothetical protein